MGFMDMFKKNSNNNNIIKGNNIIKEEKRSPIKYSITRDGKLQIDYHHQQIDFRQLYDITRLIVDKAPMEEYKNQRVYNCKVSWYKEGDVIFSDPKYGGESIDATDYRDVLAQIDPHSLQTNEEYCIFVMNYLLDKKRVMKYLEEGLKENPELLCGKYVGGVRKSEKGYEKVFSPAIGRASHYSKAMVRQRDEHRKERKDRIQKEIQKKQEEIKYLQNDLDR